MFLVLFLFLVLIVLGMFVLGGRKIYNRIGTDYKFINKIKIRKWIESYWISGMAFFFLNALLFYLVNVILYLLSLVRFQLHSFGLIVGTFVLMMGITGGFFLWFIIRNLWRGTTVNRLKMSIIGSSFYAIVELVCIYKFINESYPFPNMELYYANLTYVIVSAVIFLASFTVTGFRQVEP